MYCDAFFNVCKKLLDPGATCTQKGQCDSKGGKYRCTWGRCFANSAEGSLGFTIPFYNCLISRDVASDYRGCTIEPLSFKCCKTKNQVITLVNYNRRKCCNELIRTEANTYNRLMRARHDWFRFCCWLDEKVARVLLKNYRTNWRWCHLRQLLKTILTNFWRGQKVKNLLNKVLTSTFFSIDVFTSHRVLYLSSL